MSRIDPHMSSKELLAEVRTLVLHELEGLDPSSLVLRLDDVGDRSVFVGARLGDDCGVMVARVYEADMRIGGDALHPVYLSNEDAEALVEALVRTRAPGASSATAARTMDAPTERRASRAHDSQEA